MKRILLGLLLMLSGGIAMTHSSSTAYDFSFKQANGEEFPLSQFKGQVLLIVNTASKCGFTPQYAGLEKLYQNYKDKGLVVIGVPSNDFGKQEPLSNEKIQSFCSINYGVTFPVVQKEKVRGKEAHPFYVWAKQQLGIGTGPKWNFHKYLINRQGQLVDYFHSTTEPDSDRLTSKIESCLNEQ